MGGNYEKDVYCQLMEVMEKLNAMESGHSRDRKGSSLSKMEVEQNIREGSKRLQPFCIVKEWLRMTGSARLLTLCPETSSIFQTEAYIDSAKDLHSPVPSYGARLSRSF